MGKIESIRNAISPLNDFFSECEVTYHFEDDRYDVLFKRPSAGNWNILFHLEDNYNLSIFFILWSNRECCTFVPGWQELQKRCEMIVFSGWNLFKFLDIHSSYRLEEHLSDLYEISHLIKENHEIILESASNENLERTYNALIAMEKDEDGRREKVREILGIENRE